MLTIPGYLIKQEVYSGSTSLIYRALREVDQLPVVLKVLKPAVVMPERVAWFKREYEMLQLLNAEGVIKTYGLNSERNCWVMIMEDFGGSSLSCILESGRLVLDDFFPLAVKVAESLGGIHRCNVVHKDVNPSNIVFNPQTKEVKLIDFGIAAWLSFENHSQDFSDVLEGTLDYISPEQTGRVHQSIDRRTDFYSLGVTFYELLSGRLPYITTDPVELIHAHIAKHPAPLCDLCPDIPSPVSDIVMKLLEKNPQDRYQSAYGLKTDLEFCWQQWQNEACIPVFDLAAADVSDRLSVPAQLYGRDAERELLSMALARVRQGGREPVLVSGPSGIGKSALVADAFKDVFVQHGHFVRGKFDQRQQRVPYSAIVEALRALMRHVLSASDALIAREREKMLAAVGANGQLVIDVLPEVALILGEQPQIPELPPLEAQNRFNLVFGDFIQALAAPETPLVIFLDNLQWADQASLKVMTLLATVSRCAGLLLVGAYRDDTPVTPALAVFLAEVERSHSTLHVELAPLNLDAVTTLLADTLHSSASSVTDLAQVLHSKTYGNPFFLRAFLDELYTSRVLFFDYTVRAWQWRLSEVRLRSITDNVATLMENKVLKLSSLTQEVLKYAACIGHQFDLEVLGVLCAKPVAEVWLDLGEALTEGFVSSVAQSQDFTTSCYVFAHARIQQALYALISYGQRKDIHWRLGQLLLERLPLSNQGAHIFDIVYQLNQGMPSVLPQVERDRLAELNFQAARQAKTAAAYQTAFDYLKIALGLLDEFAWLRCYKFTLDLHVEAAEVAYLSTNFEEMEPLVASVLEHAKVLLDRVRVYEVQIQANMAQAEMRKAIEIALPVLRMLGIRLPANPNRFHTFLGLLKTKLALLFKDADALAALPILTDPYKMAATRILSAVSQAAYFAEPKLVPLLVFKGVNLSVKYGHGAESVFGYACYGMILCGALGDIAAGYKFGELALTLLERLDAYEVKARTTFLVNDFIKHWKVHLADTLDSLMDTYRVGLESGDLEYAADSLFLHACFSYFCGRKLDVLAEEMVSHGEIITRLKQERIAYVNALYHQVVLNLMGQAQNPCRLVGESYNEVQMLPVHQQTDDKLTVFYVYFNKLILNYLFGNYAQALDCAQLVVEGDAISTIFIPIFYFYDTLTRLALCRGISPAVRPSMLRGVRARLRKMRKWAKHAPMNYLHKLYLLEAELAQVQGRHQTAASYYEKAITLAHENAFLNEEALAWELTGHFYLRIAKPNLAAYYLQRACQLYRNWGALAKVKDLELCNAELLALAPSGDGTDAPWAMKKTHTTTGKRGTGTLDLMTLVRTSQVISGEIIFDKLLVKLLYAVIENAGAQRGWLLLAKQEMLQSNTLSFWVLKAQCDGGQLSADALQSIQITEQMLPLSVLNYVTRTRECVVLHDASLDDEFGKDPYIQNAQPKSVLCSPLLRQGRLVGMLYLENNATPGVFTASQLEILDILFGQVAISIENARLYRDLEDRVETRTAELRSTNATLHLEIAERKRAEAALHQQTIELAASNEDLNAFAHTVAHDLKTPLTTLIGFSRLLQKRYQKLSPEELVDYLNIIAQHGRKMTSIINELLLLASVRQLEEVEIAPLDMQLLLQEACKRLADLVTECQAEISLADTWPLALGYAPWVEEIWVNYISNAVKYGGDPPRVHLEATLQPDGYVRFCVQDNGRGLTAEESALLFNPFTRLAKVSVKGHGLGLSIVRRIVEKLGGQVGIESAPVCGSVFYFTLPAVVVHD